MTSSSSVLSNPGLGKLNFLILAESTGYSYCQWRYGHPSEGPATNPQSVFFGDVEIYLWTVGSMQRRLK
jgi:hypothetical protein